MPLCCKTKKNTPMMYEVPNKETLKSEILPHLSVAKRGYTSKKVIWWKPFQPLLYKLKASFLWHTIWKSKDYFFMSLMFLCQNGRS